MRISYQPTFSHFVDNYLATYYSAGIKTFKRSAGGPIFLIVGVTIASLSDSSWFLKLVGYVFSTYGFFLMVKPYLNLLLVWFRRDTFLQKDPISLEYFPQKQHILLIDNENNIQIPLSEINSIQHRADKTWILTKTDQLIYVPVNDLLSGNHDDFINAIEKSLDENEQTY